MTKEEVLEFKLEHPGHYIGLLQKKYADTWSEIVGFNERCGFTGIGNPQMVYNWLNDITEWPKCEVCGNPAVFLSMGKFGYSPTCSRLCARRAKTTMERRKKTSLAKFGCEHSTQCESVKEKIRKSTTEHYGIDCILKSEEFREKIRQTNLRKYGVEYPTMSPEVLARREANNIEKYGVSSPMQLESILTKKKETEIRIYGSSPTYYAMQNLNGYNEKKRDAAYEKMKSRFDSYELITTREEYENCFCSLRWRCRECGAVFETDGTTNYRPKCKCRHRDQEEMDFYNYIVSISPDAILNARTVLPSGREIDVYVPSRKIGFEFDGLYWHSELRVRNNYHLLKTNEAESVGVRLIHVFSDEWESRGDIVKETIRSILSHSSSENVFARHCVCCVVDRGEARGFLDRTHIQGADNAKIYLGLRDCNGALVAVASFNPEKKGGSDYLLSRYSTEFGITVCGGLGKILSYFKKEYSPTRIKTYADRRSSQGALYEKTGFKRVSVIPPKYWYTFDYKSRIHRFNLRKSAFNKDGMMYESNSTEKRLARINGFVRIYDCGYYRYEMNC